MTGARFKRRSLLAATTLMTLMTLTSRDDTVLSWVGVRTAQATIRQGKNNWEPVL